MSNEVTLTIDGEDFRYWDNLEIIRPIDSFTAFALSAPFDPDVPIFREAFTPFSYKPTELKIDGEKLLTGVLFSTPNLTGTSNTVICSGYSKPGVLNDCEISQSNYPLEYDDVSLQTIAESLAAPFGIDVVFDGSTGVTFDEVTAKVDDKVLAFLIKLAKQRTRLISDTVDGELLIYQPIESGVPVAALHQDQDRFIKASPQFNEQQFFSSITGLSPNIIAKFAEEFTVQNTTLSGITRPHTFKIPDTTDVDIQDVVKAKMGRMFADSSAYSITLQGWRDDNGDVWAPNRLVKVKAPGIMIYNETEFLIKSVGLFRSSEGGDTAALSLVFPGAYNGKAPEVLPWQAPAS